MLLRVSYCYQALSFLLTKCLFNYNKVDFCGKELPLHVTSFQLLLKSFFLLLQTLDKLSAILDGLIGNPPIALIFIGNFTSEPQDIRNVENLKTSFTKFATILQERAWLLNTNYVFVPGALDPNVTYTYPKYVKLFNVFKIRLGFAIFVGFSVMFY